jgi:hypothetical protein
VWSCSGFACPIPTREKLNVALASAAGVVATLVNPYGPRLWAFLHETVGFGRAEITDWQPVVGLGAIFVFLWLLIAAAALTGLLGGLRNRSIDGRKIAVVLMMAGASFRVSRLLAFFAISVVMLLGPEIHRALSRWRPARAAPHPRPGFAAVSALAIGLAVLGASAAIAARNASCIRMDSSMFPEPDIARIVIDHGLRGRMLVWFDWGEYAIWHFAPRVSVSMDGRRETVYSDAVMQQQLDLYFKADARKSAIAALAPDYIWLPSSLPVVRALRSDGWTTLFAGDRSVLLGRAGTIPSPATGKTTADPNAARCFPGP